MGVLAALAHDARPSVRAAVASNARANRAVLEHLAGDRHSAVLKAVARNAATSADVLAQLTEHRRGDVRRAAERFRVEQMPGGAVARGERPGLPAELGEQADRATPPDAAPAPSRRRLPTVHAPRPSPPVRIARRVDGACM